MMNIKQISKDEIDLIEDLWSQLKQHHQARTTHYTEYYQKNSFAKRKAELLGKDALAVFIADKATEEKINSVVGFCVVSINYRLGEVDSLYVSPFARDKGIGSELMSAGLAWLEQHKPENIRLSVGEGNEEAITYYEKLGFRKRATLMQLFE